MCSLVILHSPVGSFFPLSFLLLAQSPAYFSKTYINFLSARDRLFGIALAFSGVVCLAARR